MDIKFVAEEFVKHYYKVFRTPNIGELYRNESTLSWEGEIFQGAASITNKLTSLPFQTVQHKITTQDAQPVPPDQKIIVLVTGLLLVDDSANPLQFSQAFQLVRDGSSYYVLNDIFRLNYG